jgi:hypothetical protein
MHNKAQATPNRQNDIEQFHSLDSYLIVLPFNVNNKFSHTAYLPKYFQIHFTILLEGCKQKI